jgi:hypothetical protein
MPNPATNYEGSCHCGQVTWTVRLDNPQHILCHCDTCKKLGGGPFSCNQIVPKDDLRITKGAPKIYTYTGASGKSANQAGRTGTRLIHFRQSSALFPLCKLYLAHLPPADGCPGQDHCQDDAVGGRSPNGHRRGDLWRRKFGLDQEHCGRVAELRHQWTCECNNGNCWAGVIRSRAREREGIREAWRSFVGFGYSSPKRIAM